MSTFTCPESEKVVAEPDIIKALARYRRAARQIRPGDTHRVGGRQVRERKAPDWRTLLFADFANAGPVRCWTFDRAEWGPLQAFRNWLAFDVEADLDALADAGDVLLDRAAAAT